MWFENVLLKISSYQKCDSDSKKSNKIMQKQKLFFIYLKTVSQGLNLNSF